MPGSNASLVNMYNREGYRDPRKSHKLSEFLAAGRNGSVISYKKLSFLGKGNDGNTYVVKMVLNDYLPELKSRCRKVVLTDQERLKYQFNPKMLSSELYGTTELYYVILLLNDMINIRDFDTKTLYLLPPSDMENFLSSIYSSEKNSIAKYNSRNA